MRPARHLVAAALLAACLGTLSAAGRAPRAPVDAITTGGLERRLRVIASDALEGRESLSPGFRAAADYLADELRALGLTPRGDDGTFLQRVTMRRTVVDPEATRVDLDGQSFAYGDDLLATGRGTAAGPVVYVGHGWRVPSRGIDPFAGIDVRGAILLVLPGMPSGLNWSDLQTLSRKVDYWTPEESAEALGAVGIIRVPAIGELSDWQRLERRQTNEGALVVDRLTPEPSTVPSVTAGARLLAALMQGEREGAADLERRAGSGDAGPSFALSARKRATLTVAARVTFHDTFNVIASVEGSDPALRDQFVALGAHLDHIGVEPDTPGDRDGRPDRINNGADDDGSGVVALVEIAAAAMRGPPPARSLLFAWHTGEEHGGWGARYLTAFPPVPLDRIVAHLNVDMIGRSRKPSETGNPALSGPDEVYVVGAGRVSADLSSTIARVNREYLNLTLSPKYDDPADPERIYERSDHIHYARKGIPVAFFFSGLHDDYHRPSDEVERIDFVKLQKVARTVMAVAWALADGPAAAGARTR